MTECLLVPPCHCMAISTPISPIILEAVREDHSGESPVGSQSSLAKQRHGRSLELGLEREGAIFFTRVVVSQHNLANITVWVASKSGLC